ncbi:ABC transporter permease subunit [Bremerella sp. JC817]|uniref:phosphate ABC transporter permease PstA n=1 Tax=Bremerella sp. JC817 TaxID=3231756 RepID=UPI00345B30B8
MSQARDKQESKPQKYRRTVRPGLTVLAQGEPMIWLSGGALTLALLMIFGLLAMIVYQGMSSFWPGQLYEITLQDGTVLLGEMTDEEDYTVESSSTDSEPETLHRRQYRTDNFEFQGSGGTYRWITDAELSDQPATQPEWAMLFERTKLGRFIGFPERFVINSPRPISSDEEDLANIRDFYRNQKSRIVAPSGASEEELKTWSTTLESLDGEIAEIGEQLAHLEAENTHGFVTQKQSGQRGLIGVLASGETVPLNAVEDGQNLTAVQEIYDGPAETYAAYQKHHATARERVEAIDRIARYEVGESSRHQEQARLKLRDEEIQHDVFVEGLANEIYNLRIELKQIQDEKQKDIRIVQRAERILGKDSAMGKLGPDLVAALNADRTVHQERIESRLVEIDALLREVPDSARRAVDHYVDVRFDVDNQIAAMQDRINEIQKLNDRYGLHAKTAEGTETVLKLGDIVRAFPANQLDYWGRLQVYFARWGEFLLADPREANSEGGVFPAIWGTVAMTMIMSLIVVPFGVLAALYLREYAKSGPVVSIIRISINNLAGVPSIVFGVFGYGFLILVVGAYIDGGPANANLPTMPKLWWWITATGLALTAFTAFITTSYSLGSRKVLTRMRTPHLGIISLVLWIVSTIAFVALVAFTPGFHGFYQAGLPNPTFGKGGLLWASLTLALLTLPVVIVATEEALAAVPNSLREGSYGCGASKWQTIRRIVLPHALPGIMTGMILAMARGAGEVAPLMLVGVLKLAPELPIDTQAPFVHLDRSFMHLGFHIFDLGFQSPNSEAAKPMVFTTTLLLIAVIATLNLFAIWLRARLRRRFQSGQF